MVELFCVSTDLWTAVANAAEAAIVGAAAIVAYFQVREGTHVARGPGPAVHGPRLRHERAPIIYLTIANIGNTMARRVKITTDPLLSSSLDQSGGAEPIAKLRVFTEEIPSLAPGKVIRLLFDLFVQRGDLEDVEGGERDGLRVEDLKGRLMVQRLGCERDVLGDCRPAVFRNTKYDGSKGAILFCRRRKRTVMSARCWLRRSSSRRSSSIWATASCRAVCRWENRRVIQSAMSDTTRDAEAATPSR